MSEMIVIENLTKRFGPIVAVDDVSLTVSKGEVLGFLGPNGAGKSTTMKMVTGYLTPTAGTVRVDGFDVTRDPVEVKRRIGYLPEGAPTYGDMSPLAFLNFIAEVRGLDGARRRRAVERVIETVSLEPVLYQPIDTLSKGYKRRVGLAQAMIHDPPVMVLDEPTDGLDPNQKHHVRGLIKEMARDKAIVISTHILEEVEAVCTRSVVIAKGRIVADGTPEDFFARSIRHNAVIVDVDAAKAAAMRAEIEGLASVERVEVVAEADGLVRLRASPKDRRPIAVEVGDMIRAKGLVARELYTEHGALDEVFRRLTMGEDAEEGRDA